jgi:hypothetical protein
MIEKETASMASVVRDQGKVIRDQGKVIRDQGKVIRDQGKVIRDQGKVIRDQGKVIRDQGKVIRDLKELTKWYEDDKVVNEKAIQDLRKENQEERKRIQILEIDVGNLKRSTNDIANWIVAGVCFKFLSFILLLTSMLI